MRISRVGDLAFVFVQKSYPTHCHGYGTEIFFHPAFEDIGSHLIQHVAELIIYLWKKHGFIKAGGIFKGDEFHGLPILCMHCLPGYQPTDCSHLSPYMGMQIPGIDKIQPFQDTLVSVEGVEGK